MTGLNDIELTPREAKAIQRLERVFKDWPETLILFGGSGTLSVRKRDADGAYFANREVEVIEGVFCDGGDGGD